MPNLNLTFIGALPLPSRANRLHRNVCLRPSMSTATSVASHTLNGRKISGPLKPAGQNILVRIAETLDTTAGGIILADSAKEKPTYGEAMEVGPGKYYSNGVKNPMDINKGDVVLYGKYGGTDVEYDNINHTIVTQDDILCKLQGGRFSAEAVRPIFDKVLVKVDQAADETEAGIILSNSAKEKPTSGEVIAMGPGRHMENGEMEPAAFQVGDTIYYGKYGGTAMDFDGQQYMIIRNSEVFAKI